MIIILNMIIIFKYLKHVVKLQEKNNLKELFYKIKRNENLKHIKTYTKEVIVMQIYTIIKYS